MSETKGEEEGTEVESGKSPGRWPSKHSLLPIDRIDMWSWLVIAGLGSVGLVQGYSEGAPQGVCAEMKPQHGVEPSNAPFPYTIRLSRNKLRAGDSVEVTISGNQGKAFKGFLLQGRVGSTPVGKFTIKQEYSSLMKHLDCLGGSKNAVTHTGSSPKKQVTVKWTAPPNLKETVVFYATVVEKGDLFWVAQPSQALHVL